MKLNLTKVFALSVFSLFLSFTVASCNDDNGNNDPSIVTHEDSISRTGQNAVYVEESKIAGRMRYD